MPVYSPVVDCDEVYGSRVENFNEDDITASVQLLVLSDDKDALIDDLLSNERPYPNIASANPPLAQTASAVPFYTEEIPADQGFVFSKHVVTVNYSTDPEREIFSETIEPEAEFMRLDYRFFRWSDGTPITDGEAPGLLQRTLRLVRKYRDTAVIPPEVLTKIGYVHTGVYASSLLGLTFPARTLLLVPNPVSRTITTSGSQGYNFSIAWSFRPQGWNKFWRPSVQAYQTLKTLSGANYLSYPEEDLSALLT